MKVKVGDIIAIMERNFPLFLAQEWDNVGLQLGSAQQPVNKILVALDLTSEVVQAAIAGKYNLIITHHPLFFKALKNINIDRFPGNLIAKLIKNDISLYAAHTNLDMAERGINQLLAEKIGLQEIMPLNNDEVESLYKLAVFVPLTHVEQVRQAIHAAGAGQTGDYSECSFQSPGTGSFKPGAGTNPFLGKVGQLEQVEEIRLETVCLERDLNKVLEAMHASHPYEEVAYDLLQLKNGGKIYSFGRKGVLNPELTIQALAEQVKNRMDISSIRIIGNPEKKIKNVAVVSGSGASMIPAAARQKIDCLITGDVKYHEARDAEEIGIGIIDAGHQETEEFIITHLTELLRQECKRQGNEIMVDSLFISPTIKTI